jgi:hypothetical protein
LITILAGDRPLMSVFDTDGRVEALGLSRLVLAEVYRRRIATAIENYRAERAPEPGRLVFDDAWRRVS